MVKTLNKLRKIAKKIEQVLKTFPGARDVNANREVMITSLPIRYRHAELASFGLTRLQKPQSKSAKRCTAKLLTLSIKEQGQYDLVVRLGSNAA